MTKTGQNFEIWAGDAVDLAFGVSASDGTGQDMTGNTASWIFQDEQTSSCITGSLAGTISGSTVTVALAASDTSGVSGYYYHELSATASGSPVTLAVGTIKINKSSV